MVVEVSRFVNVGVNLKIFMKIWEIGHFLHQLAKGQNFLLVALIMKVTMNHPTVVGKHGQNNILIVVIHGLLDGREWTSSNLLPKLQRDDNDHHHNNEGDHSHVGLIYQICLNRRG